MSRKKILFIGGSINQTSQLHQVSQHLPEYDNYFTPYYADGFESILKKLGLVEMSVMGEWHNQRAIRYINDQGLQLDIGGRLHDYDLVVTSSDLVIQNNIREKRIILVQEGMTDPEGFGYWMVKLLPFLPRWIASTATTGISNAYVKFCVASEGYRDLFIHKGADPERIVVTGIPNFDNFKKFENNTFPHRHFVLVCTSDSRETLKWENRKKIILNAVKIANGRQLIFKLHPNEDVKRATREINKWAPGALVYSSGSAEEMIANCDVLITQYSSTVYVGIGLGKDVYSNFPIEGLRRMCPIQNNSAAKNIAEVIKSVIEDKTDSHNKPLRSPSKRARFFHQTTQMMKNIFTIL